MTVEITEGVLLDVSEKVSTKLYEYLDAVIYEASSMTLAQGISHDHRHNFVLRLMSLQRRRQGRMRTRIVNASPEYTETMENGGAMSPDDVIEMFRKHAEEIPLEAQGPMLANVIQELAGLLADSRGRLPKETFETLIKIGGVLYREGESQFLAKTDVDAIMKKSSRE